MINEYENTLRRIIIAVLGHGDDTDYKIKIDRIDRWKEKREIEQKKYKGILSEKRIIYYSDFYDLEVIIKKNWEQFKTVLHDKNKFLAFFSVMDTYRNTIAHGRSLFSYQEKLAKGITEDLKVTLVKHHNKNMNIDDYFIKILKISDDLGNTWEAGSSFELGMYTDSILRVDDEIEINVEAFDPKGREIEYSLERRHNKIDINNTGVFRLKIDSEMIAQSCVFSITATTDESEYKNEKSLDVKYIVLP